MLGIKKKKKAERNTSKFWEQLAFVWVQTVHNQKIILKENQFGNPQITYA